MNNSELRVVKFHGDDLITFERAGSRYVAMRRIVENMGMDWATQSVKIGQQTGKFNCCHIPTIGADGKTRQMLAMPLEKLQLWLATINPNKIKVPETRAKVERYQEESAIALHDYWTKGVAIRGDMDGVMLSMSDEVKNAIGGIVKSVFQKQVRELLPSLIESAIKADHRTSAVTHEGALTYLVESGAMKKGRGHLARRVSRALCDLDPDERHRYRCATTHKWLFDRTFAKQFMRHAGDAWVKDHNDKAKGQGSLRLVGGKANDQHPSTGA